MVSPPAPLCPRCRRDLVVGSAAGTPAHACLLCGGVWLPGTKAEVFQRIDPAAIGAAEDAARHSSVTRSASAAARCPVCSVAMERVEAASVVIDACSGHGAWFDRNELQALAKALEDRRARRRAPAAAAVGGSAVVAGALATGAAMGGAAAAVGPQVVQLTSDAASSVGQFVGEVVVEGGLEVAGEAAFSLLGSLLEGIFS